MEKESDCLTASAARQCCQSTNAPKFIKLFDDGDTSDYNGDASNADGALCAILAYRTRDKAQIDRLFRQSALIRPKWDEKRGTRTYGEITVDGALDFQKSVPSGFIVTEDGVFYQPAMKEDDENPSPVFVCSKLDIVAATRNSENGEWGRSLRWNDPDGKEHTWLMPMSLLAGDGNEIIARLLEQGLSVSPSRKGRELLKIYLQITQPSVRTRSVGRVGWRGENFILPDETIGEVLGDVWVLTNANGTGGTASWQNITATNNGPSLYFAAGEYDSLTNRLIVFGGLATFGGADVNDTWILTNANGSGGSAQWQKVTPAGNLPEPRDGAISAYDSATNRLIVSGGVLNSSATPLNDTWVLTDANGTGGSQLQVSQILPNHGGNAGTVTVELLGSGFRLGATVLLTGLGPDIVGTNTVISNASVLTSAFDLTGAAPGLRSVVVTNPDGKSITSAAAFTVQQAHVADDDDSVLVNHDRLPEAELPNARSHFIYSHLRDVARVPSVRNQLLNRPDFDLHVAGYWPANRCGINYNC